MLTRKELEKFTSTLGFTIWQVERDYLQHLFLLFMSKKISDELIFKGGTALQKVYGLNRFSIDLDFTRNKDLPSGLFENIKRDIINFGFETMVKETINRNSLLINLKIKGPLYSGADNSLTILRIEISMRETVQITSQTKEVFPIYPDVQPYIIKIMHEEEILAEKVRAIFTRNKARDIFDLRFLLKKGIKFKIGLINEKLKLYSLTYSNKTLLQKVNEIEDTWEKELKQLTSPVPVFHIVKDEILQEINKSEKE